MAVSCSRPPTGRQAWRARSSPRCGTSSPRPRSPGADRARRSADVRQTGAFRPAARTGCRRRRGRGAVRAVRVHRAAYRRRSRTTGCSSCRAISSASSTRPGYPLFTLLGKLFTRCRSARSPTACTSRARCSARCRAARSGCARARWPAARLPAYLAAFGLGVSPVFWSQSIIAEVYTLNTFFFLVLSTSACAARLTGRPARPAHSALDGAALRPEPEQPLAADAAGRAGVRGPAVAAARRDPRRVCRCSCSSWSSAWCRTHGWCPLLARRCPSAIYGPLETFARSWHVISRAGYAQVDVPSRRPGSTASSSSSSSAVQLLVQFAVAGTALAAAGCRVQRRALGRRHRGVPLRRFPHALGGAAAPAGLRIRRALASMCSMSTRCRPTPWPRSGWGWALPGSRRASCSGRAHAAGGGTRGAGADPGAVGARARTCAPTTTGPRATPSGAANPAAGRGGVRGAAT